MICEVCGNEVFRRVQTPRRGRVSDIRLVRCTDCGVEAYEVAQHESYILNGVSIDIDTFRRVHLPKLQEEYIQRKLRRMGREAK